MGRSVSCALFEQFSSSFTKDERKLWFVIVIVYGLFSRLIASANNKNDFGAAIDGSLEVHLVSITFPE